MAKPNYQYEKRQRELEKKKKKEDKAQRKAATTDGGSAESTTAPQSGEPGPAADRATPE